jgi:hypothetical protein
MKGCTDVMELTVLLFSGEQRGRIRLISHYQTSFIGMGHKEALAVIGMAGGIFSH